MKLTLRVGIIIKGKNLSVLTFSHTSKSRERKRIVTLKNKKELENEGGKNLGFRLFIIACFYYNYRRRLPNWVYKVKSYLISSNYVIEGQLGNKGVWIVKFYIRMVIILKLFLFFMDANWII